MGAASGLKALWLANFARPAEDRILYRLAAHQHVRTIMQVGIGDGVRTENLIAVAQRYSPVSEIHYIGIDLFEQAEDAKFSLKEAYSWLRGLGVQARLVPGTAGDALPRSANMLRDVDMVLISATQSDESLARGWYFLPRCLSNGAIVLQEDAEGIWHEIGPVRLEQLAGSPPRRAA